MEQSCKRFAKYHNIPYVLSKSKIKYLKKSCCSYCKLISRLKTYQNVGLYNWRNGYVDSNVFPLCKLCYKMRSGKSKNDFFLSVACILFRIPNLQKMTYKNSKHCKNIHNIIYCKSNKCNYCHSKLKLSVNKINSQHGYRTNNVQTLCWTCNRMKSDINEKVFFRHLVRLFYSSLNSSTSKPSSSSRMCESS